jgi:hypothetical protein
MLAEEYTKSAARRFPVSPVGGRHKKCVEQPNGFRANIARRQRGVLSHCS